MVLCLDYTFFDDFSSELLYLLGDTSNPLLQSINALGNVCDAQATVHPQISQLTQSVGAIRTRRDGVPAPGETG